jgi:hypothetical protein
MSMAKETRSGLWFQRIYTCRTSIVEPVCTLLAVKFNPCVVEPESRNPVVELSDKRHVCARPVCQANESARHRYQILA